MNIQTFHAVPDAALHVRITVFVEEQGFTDEIDDIDSTAIHLVLFNDAGAPIATCRVFTQDGGHTYVLGRLCVLKEHRGKAYGSTLVQAAEDYVRHSGGESLILHSQCHAKAFYEKLGYTAYGEVEDEQGCPHIWMRKEVA